MSDLMTFEQDIVLEYDEQDGLEDILLEYDEQDDLVLEVASSEIEYASYGGPYEVDPVFRTDITLDTKNKILTRDVTVKQIKITETTNPGGGITVLIG